MRTVVLYLLCLWSSLGCFSLEMEQPLHQKRQLDWSGGGKVYHYDHLALSSDISREHRSTSEEDSSSSSFDEDPVYVAGLSKSGLPGDPGIDYPILPSIPLTDFHCRGRTPGYYGDTQTACQVFHVCDISGRQDSFLCPNGTIFSQKLFACDWWYNVQCASTREHYQLNRNLFKGGNVNVYGTPSFWNWLTESEEEVYPSAAPDPPSTLAPKLRQHQKAAARQNKYIASPSPSPLGPPIKLEQITTEQTPQQIEIEQLPEPAPFLQEPTEQFEEPIQDPVEVEPISLPQVQLKPQQLSQLVGPTQWESFVPVTQPAPIEPTEIPKPISYDPDAIMMAQGFTRDYRNHYFSWVNDAVHPGTDMAPELSWADLGPNGPLMVNPNVDVQPTWQQLAPVDRRRKAKPTTQHTQNSPAVKRQTSSRPATILVQAPQPPVFLTKPSPVKKQITSPPKITSTKPATLSAPPKSSLKSKSVSHPKTVSTPKDVTPITPALKTNKTKPKQRSTTATTKTTTTINVPLAKKKYSNNDNDDVAYYDDDYRQTNQKIRDVIARQTSRFGIRIKKAKKAVHSQQVRQQTTPERQTQFVPSPKVMPIVPSPLVTTSRVDSSATNSFTWVPNQPASPYTTDPFWNHPPAQSRDPYRPSISPLPVSKPIASHGAVIPSVRDSQRTRSSTLEIYHPAQSKTFEEFIVSSTSAPMLERISHSFRPSMPIPAITSNSYQPRVRALRAHPSNRASSDGGKRKIKSKSPATYDPRLDRPYGRSHPIWKLQNWESTRI